MRRSVAAILDERARLARELARSPAVETVFPSFANFILARFRRQDGVLRALKARGILIRDWGRAPGLAGCARVTVGSPEDNGRFLKALGECDG